MSEEMPQEVLQDKCIAEKRQSILTAGFLLMLRHWRALVWTYALQLVLAVFVSLQFRSRLGALMNHSLASQPLVNGFDLGTLGEALIHLQHNGGLPVTVLGLPVFALLYLLLTAGTLFVFQTEEKALLSTLLSTGLRYFWRFVRLLLIALPVQAIVLGILFHLREGFLQHADRFVIGRAMFLHSLFSLLFVGLVAILLRIYFDLTEVYTLQLGIRGDRRIRRSLLPALQTYFPHFGRVYGSFLLIQVLGKLGLVFFSLIALQLLATPHVLPLFCLAQIGLFLLLASRFWQRGMETALAQQNPIPAPETLCEAVPDPIPNPEPEPPYMAADETTNTGEQ